MYGPCGKTVILIVQCFSHRLRTPDWRLSRLFVPFPTIPEYKQLRRVQLQYRKNTFQLFALTKCFVWAWWERQIHKVGSYKGEMHGGLEGLKKRRFLLPLWCKKLGHPVGAYPSYTYMPHTPLQGVSIRFKRSSI